MAEAVVVPRGMTGTVEMTGTVTVTANVVGIAKTSVGVAAAGVVVVVVVVVVEEDTEKGLTHATETLARLRLHLREGMGLFLLPQ